MNASKYPCTKCGRCCEKAGLIPGFPLPTHDLVCSAYDPKTKKCTQYETRPLVCRVDEYHAAYLQSIPLALWYEANKTACNGWQEKAGDPIHLRVVL